MLQLNENPILELNSKYRQYKMNKYNICAIFPIHTSGYNSNNISTLEYRKSTFTMYESCNALML